MDYVKQNDKILRNISCAPISATECDWRSKSILREWARSLITLAVERRRRWGERKACPNFSLNVEEYFQQCSSAKMFCFQLWRLPRIPQEKTAIFYEWFFFKSFQCNWANNTWCWSTSQIELKILKHLSSKLGQKKLSHFNLITEKVDIVNSILILSFHMSKQKSSILGSAIIFLNLARKSTSVQSDRYT